MTRSLLLVLALMAALSPAGAGAQAAGSAGAASRDAASCDLCHGELEFLRQHVDRLEEARALNVSSSDIARSAHGEESCASCHTGYGRWPHPEVARTATCASCHQESADPWASGVHANRDEIDVEAASCVNCHGVHDIRPAAELADGDGMLELNASCLSCHETSGLPPGDPHADAVSCASCHGGHDLLDIDDPHAWVAPLSQVATCGACHEEAADLHRADAHGSALAEVSGDRPPTLSSLAIAGPDSAPTCTSCHGGHGMLAVADTAAATRAVERCSACHQDYADRYFGTYHGKATALGSHIVATCDDCHSAHEIQPASHPASWVHDDNLVATCGTCHEQARPAFVRYDSHPDPMDRSRNAPLFYAFVFMNTLLFSVLVVFGLHTLLWWVRILIDQRREAAEGGGHG
jgi:hypothetical protein